MDYLNKEVYDAGNAEYGSNLIKYKSNALCENGCAYCTGCASAKPGGAEYAYNRK